MVQERKLVEWGAAVRPLAGEVVSGGIHLVKPFDRGVLLAAVDGLGHGHEAVAAASHPAERVLLRSGLPVTPGELLRLATDGVRTGFADDGHLNESPGRSLHRHAKGTDDGLGFAARHIGGQHE